jgi:nucleoside-diphosphate-sugar epimerase
MFVDASKAGRELGFAPGPIEAALASAVAWYESNGYIAAGRMPVIAGARAA